MPYSTKAGIGGMVDHTRSDQTLDRDIEQVGISEMCLPLSFLNFGSV